MIGTEYCSPGITCKWTSNAGGGRSGWGASLTFLDAGFCDDDADTGCVSTEGTLHTRYHVSDGETTSGLTAAIDAILTDAQRLGIKIGRSGIGPSLYVKGDGEYPDVELPPDWREQLAAQSERIGWTPCYATTGTASTPEETPDA